MTMMKPTNAAADVPARDAAIREAQTAVIDRMRADMAAACNTLVTTGRIDEGLACHVTQGKFAATLDMGRGMGGDATGPSPGFFARAGVVGCVAIGVKMLAAREGAVFRSVEVTVETDFDDSALLGLGTATAAPIETRISIAVESDEYETRVREIVDRALTMDPWFLTLRDPQKVIARVKVAHKTG